MELDFRSIKYLQNSQYPSTHVVPNGIRSFKRIHLVQLPMFKVCHCHHMWNINSFLSDTVYVFTDFPFMENQPSCSTWNTLNPWNGIQICIFHFTVRARVIEFHNAIYCFLFLLRFRSCLQGITIWITETQSFSKVFTSFVDESSSFKKKIIFKNHPFEKLQANINGSRKCGTSVVQKSLQMWQN